MAEATYTKEWLADSRIICYRFVSTGEEAADAWYAEFVNLCAHWEAGKPLLMMIDFRQPDNLLSSEALRRGREASALYPEIPGKTAFLISADSPAHNVAAMVDHVLAPTRARQIFTADADAVTWLLQD